MTMPASENIYIENESNFVLIVRNRAGFFHEALIDKEDYPIVSKHRFAARIDKSHGLVVFLAAVEIDGVKTYKQIHQIIMGKKEGHVIDHINGDRKDNRKKNLRFVTVKENAINRKTRCGQRGFYWNKQVKKYQSQITLNNKLIFLGHFDCPNEAQSVYFNKFKELNGYSHPKEGRQIKK